MLQSVTVLLVSKKLWMEMTLYIFVSVCVGLCVGEKMVSVGL